MIAAAGDQGQAILWVYTDGKMLPPTERAGLREYLEETRRGLSRFAPYFDNAVWTCSVSHLVRRAARVRCRPPPPFLVD
jgi:hypothetical protein